MINGDHPPVPISPPRDFTCFSHLIWADGLPAEPLRIRVMDPARSREQTMSKHELIDAIRQQNRSASEQFLRGFDEPALKAYLSRLALGQKRGTRDSAWVRQGAEPANALATR